MTKTISLRMHLFRSRRLLVVAALLLFLGLLWHFRNILFLGWTLVSLPLNWSRDSSQFIISQEADGFDVTFANYSENQLLAGDGLHDRVPPMLHHIMLGSPVNLDPSWNDCRQACLDQHPGWESILWTDELADKLLSEKFPDFKPTWDSYPLPIERVDALRYLVLYEYGGIVLDMDLQCRRSLGPLRRFDFVAPAAHPTGFSISFMMASKHNAFMATLIESLKLYNRNWFSLPYVTVMFSTGGHFASAVHTLQEDRSKMKVLAGPTDDLTLHTINGQVSTPLFDHLGSSSWHSFDGLIIMQLGKHVKWVAFLFITVLVSSVLFIFGLRRWRSRASLADLEKRIA